ncbi:MAG: molybdenum cofactor guanylyltransferase [Candidatus Bathycorpusculaceae bacterium]
MILAGGQARRFQAGKRFWEDKALALLFGRPLLVSVVERVSGVVGEVVVCVNDDARRLRYLQVLQEHSAGNVRVYADDEFVDVKGPIVGIFTGLRSAGADRCIVLPCDVPLIEPAVVDYLFNAVGGSCVAVPVWPDGGLESLVMACERAMAVEIAGALCELGRRRPDDIVRGAPEVAFVSIVASLKRFDPEFRSFVNINLPGDLALLPSRVVEGGPVKEDFRLRAGCPGTSELELLKAASKRYHAGEFLVAAELFSSLSARLAEGGLFFWAAVAKESEGKSLFGFSEVQRDAGLRREYVAKGRSAFAEAAENYRLEAEAYERSHVSFLAGHARADCSWCQRRAGEGRG